MYKEAANQKSVKFPLADIQYVEQDRTLYLSGTWLWMTIDETSFKQLAKKVEKHISEIIIDGSKLNYIDTVGAFVINKIIKYLQTRNIKIQKLILPASEQKFFERINDTLNIKVKKEHPRTVTGFVAVLGQDVYEFTASVGALVGFFGQFILNCLNFIKAPLQLNWNELVRTVNDAGVKGVGVAALLSFLIGITLTYEMSPQFISYGANVYVVNFLGISLLKEVSPLLTAIIVTGRTGAAITAEIGTMKVQEEIDAMQTMGISPIRRLVLPKVLGLVIVLPLVTAVADVISLVGGAIVANATLDVSYTLFLDRLQTYVSINNYTCGIIKSFFFALIISLVGCFCGFRVKGNANSIGEETTRSVVLGIILILFIDAVFAVIFKIMGV
jgi:phospholipid/cholesterol/gamma-HCH transport system permease protein